MIAKLGQNDDLPYLIASKLLNMQISVGIDVTMSKSFKFVVMLVMMKKYFQPLGQ